MKATNVTTNAGRSHRPTRRQKRNRQLLVLAVILAALIIALVQSWISIPRDVRQDTGTDLSKAAVTTGNAQMTAIQTQPQAYPAQLREALGRNPEMLQFVYDYPEKRDTLSQNIRLDGIDQGNGFPLLIQWDEQWGYSRYGDGIMGLTGCGPTVLSMAAVGLTGDTSINPRAVADYSERNGYYADGVGTKWSLMAEGCARFGLHAEEVPLSEPAMRKELEDGRPIICSVGAGDFTVQGHFILLTGAQNGGFTVHDPNSPVRSKKVWDYQTLSKQIRAMWSYSAE